MMTEHTYSGPIRMASWVIRSCSCMWRKFLTDIHWRVAKNDDFTSSSPHAVLRKVFSLLWVVNKNSLSYGLETRWIAFGGGFGLGFGTYQIKNSKYINIRIKSPLCCRLLQTFYGTPLESRLLICKWRLALPPQQNKDERNWVAEKCTTAVI